LVVLTGKLGKKEQFVTTKNQRDLGEGMWPYLTRSNPPTKEGKSRDRGRRAQLLRECLFGKKTCLSKERKNFPKFSKKSAREKIK